MVCVSISRNQMDANGPKAAHCQLFVMWFVTFTTGGNEAKVKSMEWRNGGVFCRYTEEVL